MNQFFILLVITFLGVNQMDGANPGDLDLSFNTGAGANSRVRTIAVQPNGKIVLGGDFSTFGGFVRHGIVLLNEDGRVDATFQPATEPGERVVSFALQSDGKIVIATENRIARLNADGTLDGGFLQREGSGIVLVESDGRILVAGGSQIRRLNTDGSASTFNHTVHFSINSVALLGGGKVVAAGRTTRSVRTDFSQMRQWSNDQIDPSFNPGWETFDTSLNQYGEILAVVRESDGGLLAGGDFVMFDGVERSNLVRLRSNGEVDSSFLPAFPPGGANGIVFAIAAQTNGNVLVGGQFSEFNSERRSKIARINQNGNLDISFDPGQVLNGDIHCIAIQPNGRILIGGDFTNIQGISAMRVARIFGEVTPVSLRIPEIIEQPGSQTNYLGEPFSLVIRAQAYPAPDFQWRKNGSPLTNDTGVIGADSPTLYFQGLKLRDAGSYDVIVSNSQGAVTSHVAVLTVVEKPAIGTQPASQTNQLNSNASFSVTATGSQPLSFRWQKNGFPLQDGVNIFGVTNPVLNIQNTSAADAGAYSVVVSNFYGAITSEVATLTIEIDNFAARGLPQSYHPGEIVTVRLDAVPPPGTINWTIREQFPSNWDVVGATNAIITNDLAGELIFGPFTNGQPRSIQYALRSVFERDDSASFNGSLEIPGTTTNTISGSTNLMALRQWEFVGPQVLQGDQTVSGTAYGEQRVLATSWGWTTTSKDGSKWTYPKGVRNHGEQSSLMAFLNGKFLLWGSSTAGTTCMSASEDGFTWRAARGEPGNPERDPFEGDGYVTGTAYGNGVFIAVGRHWRQGILPAHQRATIWRSTNAFEWSRYRFETGPIFSLEAVKFSDNQFIAVGSRGTVVSSTDGAIWTQLQPATDPGNTNDPVYTWSLNGVSHGAQGWIVTTSQQGSILHSTNGQRWFTRQAVGSPTVNLNYSFVHEDKHWFSSGGARGYTTEDGVSWQYVGRGAISQAFNETNLFYMAGGGQNQIFTSTNGSNWHQITQPARTSWPHNLTAGAASNEWIVSSSGALRNDWCSPLDREPNYYWTPSLGATDFKILDISGDWRNGAIGMPGKVWALADIATTASGQLAVGAGRSGLVAGWLATTNYDLIGGGPLAPSITNHLTRVLSTRMKYRGQTFGWDWIKATVTPTPAGFDFYAESGVDNLSGGPHTIRWGHFTSTNGLDWSRRIIGLNDPTNFPGIRGLVWGAGRYVAVGEGTTFGVARTPHRIYTSTNGEDYVPVNIPGFTPDHSAEALTGLSFGDGAFVTVGNRGKILYSTNGLSWDTVRQSDGKTWNRVRYLNNGWAVVGNSGAVAFSGDGRNWVDTATGVENDLNDIASLHRQFLIVGNHGMVLRSTFQTLTPPRILPDSLFRHPSGAFSFTVSTTSGLVPEVEYSENLVGWTTIGLSITSNDAGLITFMDPNPGNNRRYYRVSLPIGAGPGR